MKFALLLMAASLCFAQDDVKKPGVKYYRLDFVIKELDAGKVQSTKSYSAIGSVTAGGKSMIRSGDKVPVSSGTSTTMIDVGISIDCRLQFETPTDLALQIAAEISSLGTEKSTYPVIGQTKWDSNTVVALRKPTTVFSSESPTTKRTTQLEVTATPLQ